MIRTEPLLLIDFSAEWCGPCKMLKPVLDEVKSHFGNSLTIIKLDVDKNQQAASAYSVQGVPTLVLYKNGKIVWRQSGLVQAPDLKRIIEGFK